MEPEETKGADKNYFDLTKVDIVTSDIPSMCMYCHQTGYTKYLKKDIPHFKEILISSFECPHCGYSNNDVSFAGSLGDFGVRHELHVINNISFYRQVVKSEWATIKVPEAELEIPPQAQAGSIKTIEGYFRATIEHLQMMQAERRQADPETAEKLDAYCQKLEKFASGEAMPFTFIVEDPSGNSTIENPQAPTPDPYCKTTHWARSKEEYAKLGFAADAIDDQLKEDAEKVGQGLMQIDVKNTQSAEEQDALLSKLKEAGTFKAATNAAGIDFSKAIDQQETKNETEDEVFQAEIEVPCYSCNKIGMMRTCKTSVPHFKELIIMAFVCEHCGYRNTEIKEGGEIGERGKKITLNVKGFDQLSRDVFKSTSGSFQIPEIDLHASSGTLGSTYTTVEGMLDKMLESFKKNTFAVGDSAENNDYKVFLQKLEECKEGTMPFTLIIDDPGDNSFLYNPNAPGPDPDATTEYYERTEEQNDELGITDMNVGEDHGEKDEKEECEGGEKEESVSYIEELNITDDGGIVKKKIKAGEGDCPKKGQEVSVSYEGRLDDGTVFDASRNEPLKIRIGEGQVIQGWDKGIITMQLGEKADLVIQSKYAYGKVGSPPKIPGDATLTFRVEVVQIADRKPTHWQMSDDEMFEKAQSHKQEGNDKFKAKSMGEAEEAYRQAIYNLNACKLDNEETKKLRLTSYQNLALVLNSVGDYGESIRTCTKALQVDDKAVKAYYLRSVAYLKSQNFSDATADLKNAIKLSPGDKKLRLEYENLKAAKAKFADSQKNAMKKMFDEGLYNEKKEVEKRSVFTKLPDFYLYNKQTFFDIAIGDVEKPDFTGRIIFELFDKAVPRTAENFRVLCTGERNDPALHYKGNIFHRIIKGFMAQGGDTTNRNGTGGKSIYGDKFDDEQIWYPHTHKGVLSMANAGPNTNGSQFFICFDKTPHLNEKHTIFGRVIDGWDVVEKMQENPTASGDLPIKPITIVDCGELLGDKMLNGSNAKFLMNYVEINMNLTDVHMQAKEENDSDREEGEEQKE